MPSASSYLVHVAIASPPYATLSYLLPEYMPASCFSIGLRVAVPMGRGVRAGVILDMEPLPNVPLRQPAPYTLKSVLWPLERHPLLPGSYLDLIRTLAGRHTSQPGQVLAGLLPAGLRTTQVRIRFFGSGAPREHTVRQLAFLPPEDLEQLGRLWHAGSADVSRSGLSPLDAEAAVLLQDPPWPVRPAAKAQLALLEYLYEHGPATRRRLLDILGKGATQTLAALAGKGLVAVRPADEVDGPDLAAGAVSAPPEKDGRAAEDGERFFHLTPHQLTVFRPLRHALAAQKAATHLLFGITGSGKTALYLELARDMLAMGRSVLLLAPEVALALKLWNDAAQVLPRAERRLYHGYQSTGRREALFRELAGVRDPLLVVGTRSALLLPLENIGLIILDEEHDASFKQDEGLSYQAKEVAWYRAGREDALLLLGSATPDIKSYYAAVEGKIPVHRLTERAGSGALPEVRFIQLPRGRLDGILTAEAREELVRTVQRGDQAVILLNRRGYAPLMYCLGCGSVVKCPSCDIGLAYHKGRERLLCHYCGHNQPFPSACATCRGMQFLPMGEGTEKLEEDLSALLPPGTGVLRLDRDSARRPGRMEEILSGFARKEASVLVGTQMLSKGHHFPDVTLAVVADADLGLNLPDYRATERTFQLLLQSAGRAGRGHRPGTVLVQTRDLSHYCWRFVQDADYEGFFSAELALRERRRYPPFVRLALIRISHPMERPAEQEVKALGAELKARGRELGLTVLGPAPAPLPFLKGRRRYHCLIKADDWNDVRALYAATLPGRRADMRVSLDLDPINLL